MSRDTCPEVFGRVDGTRVVDAGSFVVHAYVCSSRFGKALLETITASCTGGTVSDHLGDLASWAGVLNSSVVTGSGAVVGLHEPWVDNSVVCCWGSNAAVGLLHDNSENEPGVDAG